MEAVTAMHACLFNNRSPS